jgi:DNA repair protein RecN (Recombination protein N)
MLKLLKISNIALIAEAELELGPGLSLLTGETGAGKSILIDALGLLLGSRAHGELIRTGETRGSAEGVFQGRPEILEPFGLPAYGDEIVIRRELSSSGRGRATVNGALVPVGLLRDLAPALATVHGQHEQQGLADSATHLRLLDRLAGVEADVQAVADLFRELQAVEAELEALRSDRREQARRRETLEFQATEIEAVRLTPGEEAELRREKGLQAHAEKLKSLAGEAYASLYEEEGAVLTRLGRVFRKIEELAQLDPAFRPALQARDSLVAPLEDLALELRDYSERLDVSPERLDEIESRLALIERLKRKYGESVEEVLAFAALCREELGGVATLEERERELEERCADGGRRYLAAAQALSGRRRGAAQQLRRRVEGELAQLAMERARLRVRLTPERPLPEDRSSWTERGLESAELLLSANPGEELRSLGRVASGGELSRILLALKSVATVDADGLTLVFDEVDAGIGGAVAEAVGRRLQRIAARQQVLCVTHLPQIASLADRHYRVSKRVVAGRTLTEVVALGADERIDEVARMLGGESVTDAARQHAREMVRQSAR